MKAAFFYGPNKISIENTNIATDSNESLILKVLSCSVCSYDVRTFRNGSFKVNPPVILGHEICAETINEVKGNNISIKAQQRVSLYPVVPCLYCWYCNHKKYNLCSNLKEIGSTLNGGFAEYISIPTTLLEIGGVVPVLDNVTNEEASLIEPLACCINGINQIKSMDFESVVILGDGPIGLMQLMLLKKHFPGIRVMIVGKIKHRLEMASRLGADRIYEINNDINCETIAKLFTELDDKRSPNLIFVSNNNIESLRIAYKLANKNGQVILFSGIKNRFSDTSDPDDSILMDANFIHYNQISVTGSFSSTPENLNEAMKLVNAGEIRIKDLITNTFELRKLEDALKTSESFRGLKSIVNKFED